MSGIYDDDFEAEEEHVKSHQEPQLPTGSSTPPPASSSFQPIVDHQEQQQQHQQIAAPVSSSGSSTSISSSTPSSSDNNNNNNHNVTAVITNNNNNHSEAIFVPSIEQAQQQQHQPNQEQLPVAPHEHNESSLQPVETQQQQVHESQQSVVENNNQSSFSELIPVNASAASVVVAPVPPPPAHAKIGLSCPRCGCMIFGGARLQIASVVLPDCQDCQKMGYGEYFYHPPKISPDETRGVILKKKNAEALKVQIEEKRLRTLNHAKMQMLMMEEYVSRQRHDKCTKVHKNEQVKKAEDEEREKKEKEEAEKRERKSKALEQKQQQQAGSASASSTHISKDTPAGGLQFDPSTVTTSSIHGAALACVDGDSLRKIATDEAARLNVSLPALLVIPGYVDLKGRRLGVKRVSTRYELGFGFSATPLHFATLACRADLVATLLDLGADPLAAAGPSSIHRTNTANASALAPTPIDLAKNNNFTAIASLLEHSVKESARNKFSQYCEKKLAAAGDRVRERNRREGAASGFGSGSGSSSSKQRAVIAAHTAAAETDEYY